MIGAKGGKLAAGAPPGSSLPCAVLTWLHTADYGKTRLDEAGRELRDGFDFSVG
jgi:hypothetical protein